MARLMPAPVREVLRNGSIVRVELAWLGAMAAQWAYLVSLLVLAYAIGGVVAAGLITTARMLPGAILAPFMAVLADRLSPHRMLAAANAARAGVLALSAAVVVLDLPIAIVLAGAVGEGILATLVRPSTMSLLPALARSPEELVAANAVTTTGEGLGTLLGPAVGGVLVAVGGPALGFAASAVALGLAATAVVGVRVAPPRAVEPAADGSTVMHEIAAGFTALVAHRSAGLLVGLFSSQTFVRGTLTVLLVAASVELLGLGDAGVGYLSSAIGAGGLVGSVGAVLLVGQRRLALPFTVALAAWGVPIALLGIVPHPFLAFAFLGIVGVANAILDVSGFTLVQRCVPTRIRGRVFGALEGIVSLTFATGSLAAPLLVALVGLRPALVVAGALLPLLAAATLAAVRRADADAVVPQRQLDLLRGIPMFGPLSMTTLEHLAGSMRQEQVAAGETLLRQGDPGDAYYVLAAGSAEILRDGERINAIGAGDGFGEIALLRDVPRTATVVALEPLTAYRLDRETFLDAVASTPSSTATAGRLVADRMARIER